MRKSFFSRYALLVLCIVFFLVPFSLRGARMSMSRTKNDVADWLPDSFQETKELQWFAKRFVGERFVVASWPGCTENDPRYQKMLAAIQKEVQPAEMVLPSDPVERDDELARRLGAKLGLFYSGDFKENWGGRNERWLMGQKSSWYFITPDGKLYRWLASDSLPNRAIRGIRVRQGGKVEGELVEEWSPDQPERYFENPRLLTARLFSSVMTGPLAVDQMAREDGALWPTGNVAEEDKPVIARRRATERLEGTLFGSVVPKEFEWTAESLKRLLSEEDFDRLPAQWEEVVEERLDQIARTQFDGSREALATAPSVKLAKHWYALCDELNIDPPAPMTCFFVTLSKAGDENLSRVCGRQAMGKPRGQLLALAENAGVKAIGEDPELHMGGPPVDNVAIDEEGSITLVRLIGYSAAIGFLLSYLCFRSFVVTIMVFLVGGIAALTSLAIVFWSGASVDAVLLSMPSLVYVLGLSGAVHIVNYYRDAAMETGAESAASRALAHGWGPCTLAAFTTALGLLSLYASNILPIRKFGLYSALGVMATLTLLFTYLPAALTLWPPGYDNQKTAKANGLIMAVGRFWNRVGDFVTRRYALVIVSVLTLMLTMSFGLFKIRTSVQLLELFDGDAKILRDYRWLEDQLGELVPMEIVVRVPKAKIRLPHDVELTEEQREEEAFRYSLIQRVEMIDNVQNVIEDAFGATGKGSVGRGLSVATFAHNTEDEMSGSIGYQLVSNQRMEDRYDELLKLDYLRKDDTPGFEGSELWRISLRLGALTGVDYGEFVHEIADAVEPALAAYRHRDQILRQIDVSRRARGEAGGFRNATVLLLGAPDPLEAATANPEDDDTENGDQKNGDQKNGDQESQAVDQTRIYTTTLQSLLVDAGYVADYSPIWLDPSERSLNDIFATEEALAEGLQEFIDCVVLVNDDPSFDIDFLKKHSRTFVDARDYVYRRQADPVVRLANAKQPPTELGVVSHLTAAERGGEDLHAIYTGVIPVVYKAQRTLLRSLAESIGWAFVMIAGVMMVLLRSGSRRLDSLLNFRGGLMSMIPNVFPVVVVFGIMGHRNIVVDIGSMMTASVAMGVAVDDTIHFLTWFRDGVRSGLTRVGAVKLAYERCATAMTQTTLIGGVGLSIFAVSTFTPTQRFGVMMLAMLLAALVGDLILLPALLASPWGRFFCPKREGDDAPSGAEASLAMAGAGAPMEQVVESAPAASDAPQKAKSTSAGVSADVRIDAQHAEQIPSSRSQDAAKQRDIPRADRSGPSAETS